MKNGKPKTKMFFLCAQTEDMADFTDDFIYIQRTDKLLSCNGTEVALPEPTFLLDVEITAGRLKSWQPVFDWLALLIDPHEYLVFHHDDPLRELGLFTTALGRFRFALAFCTAPTRVLAKDYTILGSAAFFLFPDAKVEDALRKVYVPHYLTSPTCPISPEIDRRASTPATGNGPRILLVSYFFGASRTVGVQRTNYWHKRIPELWPGATVTTVTTTPGDYPDGRTVVLPDLGSAYLLDEAGRPLSWAAAFIETERKNARSFSTLSHYWRIGLERYFEARNDAFDVVILSGNPFAVFDFAAFAKRRWSSHVILDYRDPFVNNPRILYRPEQRDWARYVERGYNFQADLVTVVNLNCVPLIEAEEELRPVIVPNGFDEQQIQPPWPRSRDKTGLVHFVHAGSFRNYTSPESMIASLAVDQHKLHHIGNDAHFSQSLAADVVECHGVVPYDQVLNLISQADCGVVFVSETGFDTPTKMYDYLAHGLDLLIVTHGPLRVGAVATTLEGLDGVYWVPNTETDLAAFLRSYTPSPVRRDQSQTRRFSRQAGTELLLDEIRRLSS